MYTKWEQIRRRVFLVSVILTAAMLVGVSYLTSQSAAATLSTQARAVELFPFAFRKHYHNPLWLHLELNSPRRLAHVYEFGFFGLFAALMMLTVPCPVKKTGYSSGTRVSIRLGIAVTLCAAVSVLDQVHKIFVEYRHFDLLDLRLDAIGYVGAVLVVTIVYLAFCRKISSQEKLPKEKMPQEQWT